MQCMFASVTRKAPVFGFFLIDSVVLVYLRHAQAPLLVLLDQIHPEILAHPVARRKVSILYLQCTDSVCFSDSIHPTMTSYLLAPPEFLYLPAHPFDHSLLCRHGVHDCPSLLCRPVQQRRKALSVEYVTLASKCKETECMCTLPMVLLAQDS